MQNMVFNNILFVLIFLYITCFSIYAFIRFMKYMEEKNKLKKIELENNKYDLFMRMDPKLAEKEIEDMIKKKVQEYAFTNFIMKRISYVMDPQINEMIKYLDKQIILEISEMYIFYIKIIANIEDETDLLNFINKKVQEQVLDFVTDFNKQIPEQ